jgi:UDP-N-acetylmuramoyl-L-alanyl-D-glutamate--2,6-diaminopimelate ligase
MADEFASDVDNPLAPLRGRVTGFAIDHRRVVPGTVFGAFRGGRVNGMDFIDEAVERGAVAVVAEADARVSGALHIVSPHPRRTFAVLAGRFYGPYPACVAAVTGTNGKTSTVELTRQLWRLAGNRAASMGTLGVITDGGRDHAGSGGLTTPDIVTFLNVAAGLRREGVSHLAYEASSHGLAQCRCEGIGVSAVAFTNLSRDHLDFHQTMEQYFQAKLRLFSEVAAAGGSAVVWLDRSAANAAYAERMCEAASARGLRLVTVGPDGATLRLIERTATREGQRLKIGVGDGAVDVLLPLIGAYQAANALVAAGLASVTGIAAVAAVRGLERVHGVRGRLERAVVTARGATVYVDYAHTPDAIAAAIAALRPHAEGRVLIVFGCGGDRDRGKRPEMGAVAVRDADVVFVTDDNPRGEDPAAIRSQILFAAPGAIEVADRRAAIAAALAEARDGDVVLLAGKGHEQGQIVGDDVLPFDDVEVAREVAAGKTR